MRRFLQSVINRYTCKYVNARKREYSNRALILLLCTVNDPDVYQPPFQHRHHSFGWNIDGKRVLFHISSSFLNSFRRVVF